MKGKLEYTVACVGTGRGWRYRVTLWNGRAAYHGQRDYARFQDAERAGKATGAKLKDEQDRAQAQALQGLQAGDHG